MKITPAFKILLTFIIFYGCQKSDDKSDFLGKWSSVPETYNTIDIEFFKDSMVVDQDFSDYSDKWTVKGSKVTLTLIRGDEAIYDNEGSFDFNFNPTKDTLFIKRENDSIYGLKFVKIKNGYDYFENFNNISINLPRTEDNLKELVNGKLNFNIFVGLKNNRLFCKTDRYQHSTNLNDLRIEIFQFMEERLNSNIDSLRFLLHIDKSVKLNKIDSIKNLIKGNGIEKVYRVFYHSSYEKTNWKENIKWYAIKEK